MAELTPAQRQFLERFILRRALETEALALAGTESDPDDGRDLTADINQLRNLIDTFAPPPGANPEEIAELTQIRTEAMARITPPVVASDIKAAARILAEAEPVHGRIERRIARDDAWLRCDGAERDLPAGLLTADIDEITNMIGAVRGDLASAAPDQDALDRALNVLALLPARIESAIAAAQLDRDERTAAALKLHNDIGSCTVAHCSSDEATALSALADPLEWDWEDPPSWEQIKQAREGLPALQSLASQIAASVEKRRVDGEALRGKAEALDVPDCDSGENEELVTAKSLVADAVTEHPTPEQLTTGASELDKLTKLTRKLTEAVAARKKRAEEILRAREACKIEHCTDEENKQLELLQAAFPDLAGAPSRDDLVRAEDALRQLQSASGTLREAVAERIAFALEAKTSLESLVLGGEGLVPVEGLPTGLSDPIASALAVLASKMTAIGDFSKPGTWVETELTVLRGILKQVEEDRAKAVEAMKLANTGYGRVRDKITEATALAEGATLYPLSSAQKSTLADLIETAAKPIDGGVEHVDAAVNGLDAVMARTLDLKRALRALKVRIDAVTMTPTNAAQAELDDLAQLKKLALDGLEEVEP